jgi:transposase InsO family protein
LQAADRDLIWSHWRLVRSIFIPALVIPACLLLNPHDTADAPNHKPVGNIHYVWICEGQLYLDMILDLYLRPVIGWAVATHLTRNRYILAVRHESGGLTPGAGEKKSGHCIV